MLVEDIVMVENVVAVEAAGAVESAETVAGVRVPWAESGAGLRADVLEALASHSAAGVDCEN